MLSSLPRFFTLDPKRVREVRADTELKREGAILYFVTDVHDLAEFCFPIDPNEPARTDIPHMSDDQVALFEVFLRRQPKPVLVQEYEFELRRNTRALEQSSNSAYTRAEMLEPMLQHIESVPDTTQPAKAVESLGRDFNIVLAVAMGIYSLGFSRWQEVITQRLMLESKLDGLVDACVVRAFREYRPSDIFHDIRDMLVAKIPTNVTTETGRLRRIR